MPAIGASGLEFSGIPPAVLLVACVWIIPAAGQIGMNPILAVTLLVPVSPPAEVLGVTPAAVVVAFSGDWGLSGVTSPFAVTTLLVGVFGQVSARHAGLVWKLGYILITAFIVSFWVLAFAKLLV